MDNSLAGKILISSPHIGDPRFEKSVIYMCSHDEDGAMGIQINRPLTKLKLADLLQDLELEGQVDTKADLDAYIGGPMSPERGYLIHTPRLNTQDTLEINKHISVSGTLASLKGMTENDNISSDAIFALGYAGWTSGQLEDELKEGAWLVFSDHDSTLIFDHPRDTLWEAVMTRIGINPSALTGQTGQA